MTVVRSIHKIDLADRDDAFLISSYEPQKKISVTVIDLNKCEAFSGSATDIELRSQAAGIRMGFSTFVDLTTKAFTEKEFDGLQFLYCLEDNCQDILFKWKSVDSDETTITIGIIKMCKNDYASMLKNVFTLLAEELSYLNKKILVVGTDRDNAMKQKSEAFSLLSDATYVKEGVEKELYSKFVLVLNEKKRKIKDLTEEDACNNVSEKVTVSNNRPTQKKKNRLHEISDSSSDEVDDQLDDINVPGPSNKKCDTSLLFLDEDEPMVVVSPSKVRNRKVPVITEAKDLSLGVKKTLSRFCDSESEDDLLNNL